MALSFSKFPAHVRTSDGTEVNRAAVVVIDGRAELAVQQRGGGDFEGGTVAVIATLDGVTVGEPHNREVVLTGEDGQTWTVGAGDGCGCRSPLRSWFQGRLQGQPLGT